VIGGSAEVGVSSAVDVSNDEAPSSSVSLSELAVLPDSRSSFSTAPSLLASSACTSLSSCRKRTFHSTEESAPSCCRCRDDDGDDDATDESSRLVLESSSASFLTTDEAVAPSSSSVLPDVTLRGAECHRESLSVAVDVEELEEDDDDDDGERLDSM